MKDDYQMLVLKHLKIENGSITLDYLPDDYSLEKKHKMRRCYIEMSVKLLNHLIEKYRPELLV
jgi:hypothetical protein